MQVRSLRRLEVSGPRTGHFTPNPPKNQFQKERRDGGGQRSSLEKSSGKKRITNFGGNSLKNWLQTLQSHDNNQRQYKFDFS